MSGKIDYSDLEKKVEEFGDMDPIQQCLALGIDYESIVTKLVPFIGVVGTGSFMGGLVIGIELARPSLEDELDKITK